MTRRVLLLLALVPLALLAFESVAHALAPALGETIHGWLAPLCHQDPARSPWVDGHSLGACWRCVGVDLGIAIAVVAFSTELRAAPWLLALGGLDWLACATGTSPDHAIERLVLGGALGAGIALGALALARLVPPIDPLRLLRRFPLG